MPWNSYRWQAGLAGGDYRSGGVGAKRTAQEQHPFHMHGHHFWVLGQGTGVFNTTSLDAPVNLVNPAYRDTVTVAKDGWTLLRFKVSTCTNFPENMPSHLSFLRACKVQFTLTKHPRAISGVIFSLQADNPGLWIMHCHIDWHRYMGQKMYFATSPQEAGQPPDDLPSCPSQCLYNFGGFKPSYVKGRWGGTGYSA